MNEYKLGKLFLGRLKKGEDLLQQLTELAEQKEITTGIVKVIGAVSKGCFGFYDQKRQKYSYQKIDGELEIASCIGNISLMDNKIMVHAHIVFSNEQGKAIGGHLATGTKIFAAEAYLQELKGEKLIRNKDQATGLSLW